MHLYIKRFLKVGSASILVRINGLPLRDTLLDGLLDGLEGVGLLMVLPGLLIGLVLEPGVVATEGTGLAFASFNSVGL